MWVREDIHGGGVVLLDGFQLFTVGFRALSWDQTKPEVAECSFGSFSMSSGQWRSIMRFEDNRRMRK